MSKLIPYKETLSKMRQSLRDDCCGESRLFLENKDCHSIDSYVAWIDVMGASNMMAHDLKACSKCIGRFHESILKAATKKLLSEKAKVYVISDGAYIVSDNAQNLKMVLRQIMFELTVSFLSVSNSERFLVRSAVSYGPVVNSEEMSSRFKIDKDLRDKIRGVLGNLILGTAFASAYKAETFAPPFGVYVDKTAVGKDKFSDVVIWKWWNDLKFETYDWLGDLSSVLCSYFDEIEADYYNYQLSANKISDYKMRIRSYFKHDR